MASEPDGGDGSTRGFLDASPDPLRYAPSTRVAWEATGMICDRIPRGARVLDVGCGTGSLSSLIVEECGAELVGIEPDLRRAEAARARGLRVEHGYYDAVSAPRLGAFDVILFVDVLEHVPDPVALVALAGKHLTPGGVVIASIPNVAHWTVRYALLRGRFDYTPFGIMDATHLRWFTARTARRVFEAGGLEVRELDWTSGAWMSVYRAIPAAVRSSSLRRLVRTSPSLFACQHIITGSAKV